MAAHILDGFSHHSLATGDPHEALVLAEIGSETANTHGSPLLRTLLLHRIALARAHLRRRRPAERTLAKAERLTDRSDLAQEPEWLYWLDHAELTAMTGRCLTATGRLLRAVRLLEGHRAHTSARAAALYTVSLARA